MKPTRLAGPYNYINGKWQAQLQGGASTQNRNPATNELLGHYPESGSKDLDLAVQAAQKAFTSWRRVPAVKRGLILLKCMQLLESRKEDLARAMTQEMGKVLTETRGDVQEAIDTALYYAGEGRRWLGQTTPCEFEDKFALTTRMSVGVCGLITPWNFPLAIPSWKIFPALLCGNTIVFKPAACTPGTATQFVRILEESGVPPGVINLIHGSGPTLGRMMVQHPGIRLISFTGSSQTGSEVGSHCGRLHKKCSLELGGKNAQIVMDDANLELALEGALWGAFGTTGQRCTATSRIIVHEQIYKEFVDGLVSRVKSLKVGNGLDPSVQMGPLISGLQLKRVDGYVRWGRQKDKAQLLLGGKILNQGEHAHGHFFTPTLLAGTPEMKIAQEEIFGPVAVIIKAASFRESMDILNHTQYGLSGSIYTQDVNRVMSAINDMQTGITYINAPTIGAEVHLPFGGVKQTGNGHREAGVQALEFFSEWKAVYIDYSGKLQKAQIDAS